MGDIALSEEGERFFKALYAKTGGDPTAQTSMYDIGSELGIGREEANMITTELMNDGVVEIKTLSGAIGITEEGVGFAASLGMGSARQSYPCLGTAPIIEPEGQEACERIATDLKAEVGKLGMEYEDMGELMADLKTIDVQLVSPRPKSEIIRACFRSLLGLLQKVGAAEQALKVEKFIS